MPKVMLNEIEVEAYLKQCVDLEPEALTEEFTRLSADYAYWNERSKVAHRALLLAEWDEEKVNARLYLQKKEGGGEAKKPTEAAVDAMVKGDQEYEAAHVRVLEATVEREHLKGVLEALRTKREMAVSLGASMRQDAQGDASMRERRALGRAAENFGKE